MVSSWKFRVKISSRVVIQRSEEKGGGEKRKSILGLVVTNI